MKLLVTGAAGMIGQKLCRRLIRTGRLAGREIAHLRMADVVAPFQGTPPAFPLEAVACDLADPSAAARLVANRPDCIFHLAAVVSGEAEADFAKGYQVNLAGTQHLLDAAGGAGHQPRFVFASSIAVFGAPFPAVIEDDFLAAPLTSYGTQKAICELLLADYSRRGLVDGIGVRLPTICVRPGQPNRAASSFFSSIIREPLRGVAAVLPVADDLRHWFASPRSAVNFLIHAAEIDSGLVGPRRALTMPGLSVTVSDILESLERVAGPAPLRLIQRQPDPLIQRIVEGWPQNFNPQRALALGFRPDPSFDEIIRAHLAEEE